MATRISVTDLMVCIDCLMYAAGITEQEQGEPYPTDPAPWSEWATASGHAVPTHHTVDFSRARCEACGTTVAARHGAAWLAEEPDLDAITWLTEHIMADLDVDELPSRLRPHLTAEAYAALSRALSTLEGGGPKTGA